MDASKSLSIEKLHTSQLKVRSESDSRVLTAPQCEHCFDDGNHISASMNAMPYFWHLYINWRLSSYNPCFWIAFAKCLFFIIPWIFNVSITICDGLVFTIWFVVWWRWFRRMFFNELSVWARQSWLAVWLKNKQNSRGFLQESIGVCVFSNTEVRNTLAVQQFDLLFEFEDIFCLYKLASFLIFLILFRNLFLQSA